MPARMHGQYLRHLFLDNDLAQNRYEVGGRPVMLGDLRLPVFSVSTETDHVAPWRSVYKLHYMSPAPLTFVLTTGGHNAGIVSEPGHPRRAYRILCRAANQASLTADEWLAQVPQHEGSWWPAWVEWLDSQSEPAAAACPCWRPRPGPMCWKSSPQDLQLARPNESPPFHATMQGRIMKKATEPPSSPAAGPASMLGANLA
jgi:poly(3-hydroxyalkanoate) synthetase